MKNKHDHRHLKRIKIIQQLFAWDCGNHTPDPVIEPVLAKIGDIDSIISQNAPKWPLEKINKVDLSVLRYAIWDLLYRQKTPPKVVIDEAIELAKEFGNQSSSAFVNGVIGSVVKKFNLISNDKHTASGSSKKDQG